MLQRCDKGVTKVLQGCYKCVTGYLFIIFLVKLCHFPITSQVPLGNLQILRISFFFIVKDTHNDKYFDNFDQIMPCFFSSKVITIFVSYQ